MKKCPNCSGEIKDRVIFCKHCGVNVYTGTFPKNANLIEIYGQTFKKTEKKPIFFWTVAMVLLAILFIILFIWQAAIVSAGSIIIRVFIAFGLAGLADILRALIKKEQPKTLSWIFAGVSMLIIGAIVFFGI